MARKTGNKCAYYDQKTITTKTTTTITTSSTLYTAIRASTNPSHYVNDYNQSKYNLLQSVLRRAVLIARFTWSVAVYARM